MVESGSNEIRVEVRKHPAPEGALRQRPQKPSDHEGCRQKAPSTRRCIKTFLMVVVILFSFLVRKHPAPEGALRRSTIAWGIMSDTSESTQHQKVH